MLDPNFSASVVYVFGRDEGAAGVIVNRPSDLLVGDALPELAERVAAPPVVFFGGPVRPDEAIVLGSHEGQIRLVGDESDLDGFEALRVFAGYSGWGPEQLEEEIALGGWFELEASATDVMTGDPTHLWRELFARQSDELQRYRTYPDDPRLN
jgi:putative transcriptional regulator